MRRQNRSCDQCRKAKRACDAPPYLETQRSSTRGSYSAGDGSLDGGTVGPGNRIQGCSYCQRTKKRCTFNWVQSQLQSRSSAPRSARSVDGPNAPRGRQKRHARTLPRRPLITEQFDLSAPTLPDLLETYPEDNAAYPWDPVISDLDSSGLRGPFDTLPQGAWLEDQEPGAGFPAGQAGEITEDPGCLPGTNFHSIIYPTSQYGRPEDQRPEGGPNESISPDWSLVCANSTVLDSVPSQYNAFRYDDASPFRRRQSYYTSQDSSTPTPSLSLFSAQQSLLDRSNNNAISGNLLRIYHDVVEYSLACWLTEDTCPYNIGRWDKQPSPGLIHAPGTSTTEDNTKPTPQEWTPSWANRIYGRVIKLDKVAQSTKLIQVTKAEDRTASKALRLVIMAFATQWAQKSQRAEERYEQSEETDDLGAGLAEEFDRSLQRSLWEQARRALQDCADLETFKVVCAEVIFGWTQKPWEEDDAPCEKRGNIGDAGSIRASLASQLEDIISRDGLPVFLERAARKMRALKFKVDAHDVGLSGIKGGYTDAHGPQAGDTLDSEDRGTVGLLYWLAVMADTISSSMHERPVVLADEDCQHDGTKEKTPIAETGGGGNKLQSQRWWVDLFIQDNPTSPLQSVRWPCSHEDAAWAVQKSVSVKVLLWRHVSYLQNSLRGRSRGQPVEDIIHSAMLVYRYWNVTYGVFFRDLVENYDAVPPRIRGWFVCIHAHWHLAALMLADLISFVDENDLGTQSASQARGSAQMPEQVRSTSANELAELSRVSTPAWQDGSGDSPAMPGFHFAINAGSILTEPWTIILIRAYSKAYFLHFGKADELWRHDRTALGQKKSEDCRESLRRCEDCIRALWFLGKKSDMSRRVAGALTQALKALEMDIAKDDILQPPYSSNTENEGLFEGGLPGPALFV